MDKLPLTSLVDDVLCVLRAEWKSSDDIKAVEHEDGWCSWSELISVPGIREHHDYHNYGWLRHFVVRGDNWMLEFDRNQADEYYNKWVFASTEMTTHRRAVPELSRLITRY
jgi:hypothetical protein